MPPKNAHGWHSAPTLARRFCATCLPPPLPPFSNVTTSQVNVIAPVFYFYPFLSHGDLKKRNLKQFMFSISVIESHSYIRGQIETQRYRSKTTTRICPSLLNNVSCLFLYSLPLSPPLAGWMINSQLQSQQQLLADRPDMRIAA